MRILIVNKFARVMGGADRHCLDLAQALVNAGHAVGWLSTDGPREFSAGAFIPCSVTATAGMPGFAEAQRAARRSLWNATAASALQRLVEEFAPDVVHVHKLYPQLSVAPLTAARRLGLPVVQTLHDYELLGGNPLDDGHHWPPPRLRLGDRAWRSLLWPVQRHLHRPAVDAWVAGSRYVAARYADGRIKATVLPLPVSLPDPSPPGFESRRGVAFVGRLADEKGVGDLIELARRTPRLELTVAGFGPLEADVIDAAERLPNLRYVSRLSVRAISSLLAGARLAVLPSRWAEPVGLSALEAMAVGTPVVAYRAGGLTEHVSGSGGGVLCVPAPASLARACLELHDDRARWTALSAAGHQYVAREHAPERYVDRLLEVYAFAGVRAAARPSRTSIATMLRTGSGASPASSRTKSSPTVDQGTGVRSGSR